MMNRYKLLAMAMLAVAIGLTGCDEMALQNQNGQNPAGQSGRDASYINDSTITGDQNTSGRGAVDAAMEWAEKYAKVAQELLYANKRIGEMQQEKKKLHTQVATLKAELAGYQRELNDANAMLCDMKKDLREWRNNVLGFKKQIMASQNALLISQQRILELLGGEVSAPGPQAAMGKTNPKVAKK